VCTYWTTPNYLLLLLTDLHPLVAITASTQTSVLTARRMLQVPHVDCILNTFRLQPTTNRQGVSTVCAPRILPTTCIAAGLPNCDSQPCRRCRSWFDTRTVCWLLQLTCTSAWYSRCCSASRWHTTPSSRLFCFCLHRPTSKQRVQQGTRQHTTCIGHPHIGARLVAPGSFFLQTLWWHSGPAGTMLRWPCTSTGLMLAVWMHAQSVLYNTICVLCMLPLLSKRSYICACTVTRAS
jgi:hypothetical protein